MKCAAPKRDATEQTTTNKCSAERFNYQLCVHRDILLSPRGCLAGRPESGELKQGAVAMRDDPLLDQLRAQLKTYVEARERAELIAKAHPNKDIGREMAEFRKALDGAIAGALTILFAIPRARRRSRAAGRIRPELWTAAPADFFVT
jgi:hypothetical protein